jgi:hypothetical protein
MHVLRYAGGQDLGGFSFGHYGSSYYGKGNALTGIGELDLYRTANKYGYAQDADKHHEQTGLHDDEHHANLEQQLADAKQGFDDML